MIEKQNTKRTVAALLYLLMFILISLLLISSLTFKRDSPTTRSIIHLNSMEVSIDGGQYKTMKLPTKLTHLKPGTQVTLHTTIKPHPYDGVYVKSKFAKANVYLDDKLVFILGRSENYPKFMLDPAKETHIIETYGKNRPMDLKITFFSPQSISSLVIDAPMIGTSKELMLEKTTKYGLSMIFSMAQYLWGFALLLISIYLMFIDKKGIILLWLGLFAMATGSWFFGSNDMAITIFPNTTFLYLSAYIGFVIFVPALIKLIRTSVDVSTDRILRYMEGITFFAAFIAYILQITGIYPLHKTSPIIQKLILASLIIIIGLLIVEYVKFRSSRVKDLILSMTILTIGIIAEIIINYVTLQRPSLPPAQIATLIFLLAMGVYTGRIIRDNVELTRKEKELAIEKEMLEIQTAEQRESRLLLAENEKILRRQRHDMRHHLIAMQGMLEEGDDRLKDYLSSIIDDIPTGRMHYCDNGIVDAMISHFAGICHHNNIDFSATLVVPETDNQSLDSDLCVIFANLLENATEACLRMDKTAHRSININSKLQHGLLVITMDNSYNGRVNIQNGQFRSSKRNQVGIGLNSVRSIVEQHSGSARFIANDGIFESSVYLKIQP